jgi:hypothetical protein
MDRFSIIAAFCISEGTENLGRIICRKEIAQEYSSAADTSEPWANLLWSKIMKNLTFSKIIEILQIIVAIFNLCALVWFYQNGNLVWAALSALAISQALTWCYLMSIKNV